MVAGGVTGSGEKTGNGAVVMRFQTLVLALLGSFGKLLAGRSGVGICGNTVVGSLRQLPLGLEVTEGLAVLLGGTGLLSGLTWGAWLEFGG